MRVRFPSPAPYWLYQVALYRFTAKQGR